MKLIILAVVALAAVALAAPVDQQQQVVPIVRSDFDQQPNGGYVFAVETGDGTKREETGEVKSVPDEENKPREVVVVRGSYSYVDNDGKPHDVVYYADETGFHAESADIPKAQ